MIRDKLNLVSAAMNLLNRYMTVKFYQQKNLLKDFPTIEDIEVVFDRLKDEMTELGDELKLVAECKNTTEFDEWVERVQLEIADVANYCALMILLMEMRK
jgi:hypothetical protein